MTNIDGTAYLGRLAICRIANGTVHRGQTVAWCRTDGSIQRGKVAEILITSLLSRRETEEAGPGEIVAIAGFPEITIGETLADSNDPRPLPILKVDEPSLSMTFGVNTSPLAGRDGSKLTARQIKSRLDSELVGNVSIRVLNTARPDTWEVQGRGELALAVLVETMRREGFELTVGKPQVLTKEIDGKVHEPVERLEIDMPEEFFGPVTQALAQRKGSLDQVINHGSGWVRMTYYIPSRGLIGIRTELLTQTKGTAIINHGFERWEPWAGEMRNRSNGSLIADRTGVSTAYALLNLQERGTLFIGPGEDLYEGMLIGENSRNDDMDVNPTKEKKLTNIRSSTAEEFVRLTPPLRMTLEAALEYLNEDESVEVTPRAVRLRKVVLQASERAKHRKSGALAD